MNNLSDYDSPRARMLGQGGAVLSDAELLAVLFGSGSAGRPALALGQDLLARFDSIRQVLTARKDELMKASGIGSARVAQLHAVLEMNWRFLEATIRKQGPLSSPRQAADYLTHRLRDLQREVFAVIYLDTRHQVLGYEELFRGTLNGATVHPREVVRSVVENNASAVILAHNHPSGIAEPSQSDASLPRRLRESLELIDVRLLDHLVIGDGEFVSMSDRGLF